MPSPRDIHEVRRRAALAQGLRRTGARPPSGVLGLLLVLQEPAGGLIEYYADEDQLTAEWQPREFEPGPTVFAEWRSICGLDGHTRRRTPARRAPS